MYSSPSVLFLKRNRKTLSFSISKCTKIEKKQVVGLLKVFIEINEIYYLARGETGKFHFESDINHPAKCPLSRCETSSGCDGPPGHWTVLPASDRLVMARMMASVAGEVSSGTDECNFASAITQKRYVGIVAVHEALTVLSFCANCCGKI